MTTATSTRPLFPLPLCPNIRRTRLGEVHASQPTLLGKGVVAWCGTDSLVDLRALPTADAVSCDNCRLRAGRADVPREGNRPPSTSPPPASGCSCALTSRSWPRTGCPGDGGSQAAATVPSRERSTTCSAGPGRWRQVSKTQPTSRTRPRSSTSSSRRRSPCCGGVSTQPDQTS